MDALGSTWFSVILELLRWFKAVKRDERIGTQEEIFFSYFAHKSERVLETWALFSLDDFIFFQNQTALIWQVIGIFKCQLHLSQVLTLGEKNWS